VVGSPAYAGEPNVLECCNTGERDGNPEKSGREAARLDQVARFEPPEDRGGVTTVQVEPGVGMRETPPKIKHAAER
jgi:hypothetical protein